VKTTLATCHTATDVTRLTNCYSALVTRRHAEADTHSIITGNVISKSQSM